MENDSQDIPAAPAAPVEDQTPPIDYEPQVELAPDQEPGVQARASDVVQNAENQLPHVEGDGDSADEDDDDAVDDPND